MRPLLDGQALKAQMPQAAEFFAGCAEITGREHVVACIRAAIALRRLVDADDYEGVRALYRECRRLKIEPAHAAENGWELGVSAEAMTEFAARHRARQRGQAEAAA